MSDHWIPDGNGGFIQGGGDGLAGVIAIFVIPLFVICAILLAPAFIGAVGYLVISSLFANINEISPQLGIFIIIITTSIYTMISVLFFTLIYPKTKLFMKLAWGLVLTIFIVTPIIMFFREYSGQLTGLDIRAEITNISDPATPPQPSPDYYDKYKFDLFTIKNTGDRELYVRFSHITNQMWQDTVCLIDANGKITEFHVSPGQSRNFICATQVKFPYQDWAKQHPIILVSYETGYLFETNFRKFYLDEIIK